MTTDPHADPEGLSKAAVAVPANADAPTTATLAAGELSLTHSAISRQLKHLEGQIGVTLFDRAGRALVLTPAGRDYAATMRRLYVN